MSNIKRYACFFAKVAFFCTLLAMIFSFTTRKSAATTQSSHYLWVLSTDANRANASLIGFDLTESIGEINLPSELHITSALWSPDMLFIAYVVADLDEPRVAFGKKVCVWGNTTATQWCEDISIAAMVNGDFGTIPVPMAWSQDSQFIYVASNASDINPTSLQITRIDVQSKSITTIADFALRLSDGTDVIIAWKWASELGYAAVTIHRLDPDLVENYILDFSSETAYQISASYPLIFLGWSEDKTQIMYAIIKQSEEGTETQLETASVDESGIMSIGNHGNLEYREEWLLPFYTIWSSEEDMLIFMSEYGYNTMEAQTGIFKLELKSRQIAELYTLESNNKLSGSTQIGQLALSPDNQYIAEIECDQVTCRLNILTVQGDFVIGYTLDTARYLDLTWTMLEPQ